MRKQFHATVDAEKKTLRGGNLEENMDGLPSEGEEGEIWQVKDGKKRGQGQCNTRKKQEVVEEREGGTTEEKLEQV